MMLRVETLEPPLWCIKYRPKDWSDFFGQDNAVERLKEFAGTQVCPHMIFVGPYGTGKTSAAKLFARKYLQDDLASNYMWLNVRDLINYPASKAKRSIQKLAKLDRSERTEFDEYMSFVYREAKDSLKKRGISRNPNRRQMLQEAIHIFASTVTVVDERVKILVLDEADALSYGMQQALRRTMEIYSDVCRFILITPNLAGWSPAILSRSIIIRFPAVSESATEALVKTIAQEEDVRIDKSAIETIARESKGNLRRATNLFQMAHAGCGNVSEDSVYEVYETELDRSVREIVSNTINGDFLKARKKLRYMLTFDGFSPNEVILGINRDIIARPFPKETVSLLLDRIAEIDHRMIQARNPFIQLEALLASIAAMTDKAN
jgi:replication factor C small subunit